MINKHTPAPWNLNDPYDGDTVRFIEIVAPHITAVWVASVHGTHVGDKDDEVNKANAQLIAAAPELLEALQEMLIAGADEEIKTLAHKIAHTKAHKAIAKAKGE